MAITVPGEMLGWACPLTADPNVLYAVLALSSAESGDDPNALGDWTLDCVHFVTKSQAPPGSWPTSFGLLQLHSNAGGCPPGLGNGYSQAQLLDPTFNLTIGIAAIAGALGRGASLYDAIGPWSTRPTAWPVIQAMQQEGITPTCADWGGPCPPGYVFDPASGGCVLEPQPVDATTILAALVGLGLIGAGYYVYRNF